MNSNGKLNCWQAKHCGREPGGINAKRDGVCPAATDTEFDGVNGGHNAGRACWVVGGTFCRGAVQQGSFVSKYGSCIHCDFYLRVQEEEGVEFKNTAYLLNLAHVG